MLDRKDKEIYSGFVLGDAHQACAKVRLIIKGINEALTLDSDQIFDVRVILSELLQNAIKHGNSKKQQKIFMNVQLSKNDILTITIKDQGQGFNVRKILQEKQKQIENEAPDLAECGRGLQIVKNLCDDLLFNQNGNCITVRKKLQ